MQKYFGGKVQKISINAGATCPNRDGTVGRGGCTYCNNRAFSPEYCTPQKSITAQLEEGKRFFARKSPGALAPGLGGRYRTRTCDPPHVKRMLIPAELIVRVPLSSAALLLYDRPLQMSRVFFAFFCPSNPGREGPWIHCSGAGSLVTSTHSRALEYFHSSSRLSSMALEPLPTAGKTVSKRLRLSSR